MVTRSRARWEECVQMPGKMARSAPRPPFGLPDAPVAVRTSRLSCGKAGNARIFTPVWDFSEIRRALDGGKVARSAPRPPFGLPDAPVAVRTSRLSCGKAGKARIFTPVWDSSGESRIKRGSHERQLLLRDRLS